MLCKGRERGPERYAFFPIGHKAIIPRGTASTVDIGTETPSERKLGPLFQCPGRVTEYIRVTLIYSSGKRAKPTQPLLPSPRIHRNKPSRGHITINLIACREPGILFYDTGIRPTFPQARSFKYCGISPFILFSYFLFRPPFSFTAIPHKPHLRIVKLLYAQ